MQTRPGCFGDCIPTKLWISKRPGVSWRKGRKVYDYCVDLSQHGWKPLTGFHPCWEKFCRLLTTAQRILRGRLGCANNPPPMGLNSGRSNSSEHHTTEAPGFRDKMQWSDFASRGDFFARHGEFVGLRKCQNIKRFRAEVEPDELNKYFNNLSKTLEGVPPQNILNYD
ncbi:hypothetical protein PoB_007516800 [Plakobranchus ocellatus]|uniref:Uncharacterized protein n=1 Tax=Plakobranchus ocellatus TaxID=259542 RepID=A0AAV4DWM3_9GAST|nr:hypothetical protein PoB_007516800 [Plakobranchus ocellatus]